jgi:hypothetical protein
MSSEKELEVYRQFTASQEKYDYFLMSVSGASIAFAIHRTTGVSLDCSMVILGVAVILWTVSFFAGCRRRAFITSTLYANCELLRVQNGRHPEVGLHPERIAAASEGISKACEFNSKRAVQWANVQLYSLILGALFFIVWHVTDMAKLGNL